MRWFSMAQTGRGCWYRLGRWRGLWCWRHRVGRRWSLWVWGERN
jgi:hypothetical protein